MTQAQDRPRQDRPSARGASNFMIWWGVGVAVVGAMLYGLAATRVLPLPSVFGGWFGSLEEAIRFVMLSSAFGLIAVAVPIVWLGVKFRAIWNETREFKRLQVQMQDDLEHQVLARKQYSQEIDRRLGGAHDEIANVKDEFGSRMRTLSLEIGNVRDELAANRQSPRQPAPKK